MKRYIMNTKSLSLLFLLLFMSVFVSGCFGVDSNFISLRNKIINSIPRQFHKNIEFSLGAFGLSAARDIINSNKEQSKNTDIINKMLDCISKVQISVYKSGVNNSRVNNQISINLSIVNKIDNQMYRRGYQYIVKNYSRKEMTMVYVKQNSEGELAGMYVISINSDELTIVQIQGDLNKLFELIIKDNALDKGNLIDAVTYKTD